MQFCAKKIASFCIVLTGTLHLRAPFSNFTEIGFTETSELPKKNLLRTTSTDY